MSELKGTYYYFKDLVDKDSMDYGKIAIIKADSYDNAWNELAIRHIEQYGETNQPMKALYLFTEKREIN